MRRVGARRARLPWTVKAQHQGMIHAFDLSLGREMYQRLPMFRRDAVAALPIGDGVPLDGGCITDDGGAAKLGNEVFNRVHARQFDGNLPPCQGRYLPRASAHDLRQ